MQLVGIVAAGAVTIGFVTALSAVSAGATSQPITVKTADGMEVRPSSPEPPDPNGPLIPKGGPVQTAPAVYVVYWGWTSDPSSERPYLENFLSSVGGTSWSNTLRQYGVSAPAGLLKGTWSDSSTVPAVPTYDQMGAEALSAAAHFGLSQSANTQIVVALPAGHHTIDTDPAAPWDCAWHATAASPSYTGLPFTNLPYMTDLPGCGQNLVNSGAAGLLDGVSIVEGHELAETLTDPLIDGWKDAQGEEVGDKCVDRSE